MLSRVSFDVKINRTRLLKAYNVTPSSSLSCPSEVAVVISSQELQEEDENLQLFGVFTKLLVLGGMNLLQLSFVQWRVLKEA